MAEEHRTTVVKERGSGSSILVIAALAVVALIAVFVVFSMNRGDSPADQIADATAGVVTSAGDAVDGAAGAVADR